MLWKYLKSKSSQIGFFSGALFYLSYSFTLDKWSNIGLIGVSLFIGISIPLFSRLSNALDEYLQSRTALVTPGRISRFLVQFTFNMTVFLIFLEFGVITNQPYSDLRGIFVLAILTSLNSQGSQYLALSFANRELGNKNTNVVLALAFNIFITCLAVNGVPYVKQMFVLLSMVSGGALFLVGALSDIRCFFAPKKGVGVFFGTFNPMHKTHIYLINEMIKKRNLSHVYLHPTVVPKLHRDALENREIIISAFHKGMRIYQKTEKADVHTNYFPTGNRFYEYETRRSLITLQLKEANIVNKVTLLDLPKIYKEKGFYGVISKIKELHPSEPIHGLHGSDLGGMWIRSIYDESGWIYPFNVVRRDGVSATAIRNGTKGMVTATAEKVLSHLMEDKEVFTEHGLLFTFRNGVLKYENL